MDMMSFYVAVAEVEFSLPTAGPSFPSLPLGPPACPDELYS